MARKKQSVGTSLGGVIVGLDYMIFKTGKPPAEQVESAKPVRPVAADDGGTLVIELPEPVSRDAGSDPTSDPTPSQGSGGPKGS